MVFSVASVVNQLARKLTINLATIVAITIVTILAINTTKSHVQKNTNVFAVKSKTKNLANTLARAVNNLV